MAEFDLNQTQQTQMDSVVSDLTLDSYTPDVVGDQKETAWVNDNYEKQLGIFKNSTHFHRAVTALTTWSVGRGYEANPATKVILENIRGRGNQSFDDIIMSLQNIKKVAQDAYAEIIRNDAGTLINFKILGGDTIRVIFGGDGIIDRYEQIARVGFLRRVLGIKAKTIKKIPKEKMFHISNDIIADELHGVSLAELVTWVVTAIREAETDWKRISHRSTIRVLYIDSDDTDKLNRVRTQYAEGIKNGEVLIIPAKKGEAEFEDLVLPPIDAFLRWIDYLVGQFYQIVGVPRVIATSEGFTESSSKMGIFSFNPTHEKESMLMEKALWNQVAIKVRFNRPPDLNTNLNRDEAKDTGQLGIQPNDANIETGK